LSSVATLNPEPGANIALDTISPPTPKPGTTLVLFHDVQPQDPCFCLASDPRQVTNPKGVILRLEIPAEICAELGIEYAAGDLYEVFVLDSGAAVVCGSETTGRFFPSRLPQGTQALVIDA